MFKVVIAAASPMVLAAVAKLLKQDPEFQIVAATKTAAAVLSSAKLRRPDLIIIASDLCTSENIQLCQDIMIEAPTPIVLLTAKAGAWPLTAAERDIAKSAVAVLALPGFGSDSRAERHWLLAKLKAMAQVKVVRQWRRSAQLKPVVAERNGCVAGADQASAKIIAIAASTGGPAALSRILRALVPTPPVPILVVQHIASGFDETIINWLNSECPMPVKLAAHNERLSPGTVYLAPNDFHLGLASRSTVALVREPPIGGFRPSATYLFEAVAHHFGKDAVALILTGMGSDGVEGLHRVRAAGGTVLAQDEATSVVFGMPNVAAREGVVNAVLPLDRIAASLLKLVYRAE